MSNKIQFLILPYVNFRQDFVFDEFNIWQNTSENWIKNFGFDNTKFLERFLNGEGKLLGKNIYVISTNSSDTPYQKWERLVHTLFYLVDGLLIVTADDFYFEIWEWDMKDLGEGYTKHDKFSATIVAPGAKVLVYPDQYARYDSTKNINPSSSTYSYFQDLFHAYYNSHILRSISYFFKTQYRNTAHFSHLDDIVNYCSAFQTFFEIDDKRGLGKTIAEKLANSFDVQDNTKQKIKNWMEKFYKIRSNYSHGAIINFEDLHYNNIRHIDIAGIVFHALINRQHSTPGFEYLIEAQVLEIFDSQENFDNLMHLLIKNRAKENIFSCEEKELIKIRNLFYDINLHTNTSYLEYKNKNQLKKALKTILSICGNLCKDYQGSKGKKFYVEPLKKIQNIFDNEKNFEQIIDKFPRASIDAQESNQTLNEVNLREIIPLGFIFESFGKILDVYSRQKRLLI